MFKGESCKTPSDLGLRRRLVSISYPAADADSTLMNSESTNKARSAGEEISSSPALRALFVAIVPR
jgi:hypothetical protein